jgi:hypothetical protein
VLAVGRNILEIAYHLLSAQNTYRELGIAYFDRHRAERLKRRNLAQLQPHQQDAPVCMGWAICEYRSGPFHSIEINPAFTPPTRTTLWRVLGS